MIAIWTVIAVVVGGSMYLYWLHVEAAAKVDLLGDKMEAELKRLDSRCDDALDIIARCDHATVKVLKAATAMITEQHRDIALILDHLGLEIQEPTTTTTPRRLVPKVQQGGEGC
jgi:hypothetical protein